MHVSDYVIITLQSGRNMNIKEIAKKLGVSTATVSRALNDQPGVSQEMREMIIKTATQLEYLPNHYARGLATRVSQTIGFVVDKTRNTFSDDPFYPLIMAGAEDFLSQYDYHILVTTLDEQITQPNQLSIINRGIVDGLILAGPFIPVQFIISLIGSNIPFVLVDNTLSQQVVNCVLNDDEGGGYASAMHLIEHGHQRIAFLSGPKEWVSNRERLRGYKRAMEESGLEEYVLQGTETTISSGEAMMKQALEKWSDLTAVCAINDSVAIGAIRAAIPAGRRIPDDLAVMGFDDISWAIANQPSLSTVRVFKQQIGYLAAQCLISTIHDPHLSPVKTCVTTELVIRDTCCCHSTAQP